MNWFKGDFKNYIDKLNQINELKSLEKFKEQIFSFFQVDLERLDNFEFLLTYKFNFNLFELDFLAYYRFQNYVKNLEEYQEKHEKKESNSNAANTSNMFSKNAMEKSAKSMTKDVTKGFKFDSKNITKGLLK